MLQNRRLVKLYDFNPRLREGGDEEGVVYDAKLNRFQSTPPRGRRRHWYPSSNAAVDFNPRLREGGDFYPTTAATPQPDFNPRLREGGDTITITNNK